MAGEPHPRRFPVDGRCGRARQWSSLRLDGELSELEVALLEKHLENCSECRAFDGQVRSTAELLRTTPAEVPSVRFELPPSRRVGLPLSRVAAVAAVIAAAALGSLVGSRLERPAPQRETPAPQVSFLTRDLSQLRELPRHRDVTPATPSRNPGGLPEGII